MIEYAPVIVFVFKRPEHTRKCLQALDNNYDAKNHDLFIFADGARNEAEKKGVDDVRYMVRKYSKNSHFNHVTIKENDRNRGLANSIIEGVTQVIREYGCAIVVEDDLVTSRNFLLYMNGALSYYENDGRVGSVSASTYPVKGLEHYPFDVYMIKKGECWGWGTWNKNWEKVDWLVSDFLEYRKDRKQRKAFNALENGLDGMLINQMEGKIDSWAVRWCYYLFKNDLLTVYPKISKALNIGFDGSGTHCNRDYGLKKSFGPSNKTHFIPAEYNAKLAKQVAEYETCQLGILSRLMMFFAGIMKNRELI